MLLIYLREKYINLFKKKILLLEKNNEIIDNKILLFFCNKLYYLNFKYIIKLLKINMIYEIDNLIFYDENKNFMNIYSSIVILDCKLIINNNLSANNILNYDNEAEELFFNITDNIKKYSFNIPIFIIVKLENIDIKSNIKINVLSRSQIKIKEYDINDILYKKLYEILE